jgi:ATP-dependent DNA helicase RecG
MATLRFFHFSNAQKAALRPGQVLRCFGSVRRRGGQPAELIHPEYRHASAGSSGEDALTPVYPSTEGISQAQWRKLCGQALTLLKRQPPQELLPAQAADLGLAEALAYLHHPPPDADQEALREGRHPAQLRLAVEELVAHQLSMRELRRAARARGAPVINAGDELLETFIDALPFAPTSAQQRVIGEIRSDLARDRPMLRLVQGDVGSGKTLVAAAAALLAIASGYQVAVMAPTELLAEQHRRNFSQWFDASRYRHCLAQRQRQGAASRAHTGCDCRRWSRPGHRYPCPVPGGRGIFAPGPGHRGRTAPLRRTPAPGPVGEKRRGDWRAHQLIMTATPIPRTLSMVAYADLDCSVIDELPPGRQAVTTVLIDNQRRAEVVERVARACREGRQVYWVCTLIEDSDSLQAQAAESTFAELAAALDDIPVGLVHGRMKPREKDAVMSAFKAGEYRLLVATTVIEVGVDVPNASLMIIENPERLGLAQLHQLRGRVGRGSAASHCVLLYQAPLGQHSKARLQVMRASNDGFFIAEEDLRQRGPGEVLGTRQTGLLEFRVARLPEHDDLLEQVQDLAEDIRRHHPQAAAALIRRWTGERQAFAAV